MLYQNLSINEIAEIVKKVVEQEFPDTKMKLNTKVAMIKDLII